MEKTGLCGVVFSAFRLHLHGPGFFRGSGQNHRERCDDQKEILRYFGDPARKGLENGYETWTYSYQSCEFGQLRDFKEL